MVPQDEQDRVNGACVGRVQAPPLYFTYGVGEHMARCVALRRRPLACPLRLRCHRHRTVRGNLHREQHHIREAVVSDPLLEKVRERISAHVSNGDFHFGNAHAETMDAIAADVETALVLARREGYVTGAVKEAQTGTATFVSCMENVAAPKQYPLPTRTRQVLREEPVPGQYDRIYRVRGGRLECRGVELGAEWSGIEWHAVPVQPVDFQLMRHAIDLHDNPYRTEEVPADESDPWGEGGGRAEGEAEWPIM